MGVGEEPYIRLLDPVLSQLDRRESTFTALNTFHFFIALSFYYWRPSHLLTTSSGSQLLFTSSSPLWSNMHAPRPSKPSLSLATLDSDT